MATGAGQGGLGVVHRRARTPLGVIRSVAAGVAVIAGHTASRRNVRARGEARCSKYRAAVLVTAAVAGRAVASRCRVVTAEAVVLAACPGRRRNAADGCGQRGGVANIARPCEWDVAVASPQGGIGRCHRSVVAGRAVAGVAGGVLVQGAQPVAGAVAGGAALRAVRQGDVDARRRVVRHGHHAVAVGTRRGLVRGGRVVTAGTRQRGLRVVHRRVGPPLAVIRRVGAGMAVIARGTARRQNVRARREARYTQHRYRAGLRVDVRSIMAVHATPSSRRYVRMILTSTPRRRGDVADRSRKRILVANIASPPCRRNVLKERRGRVAIFTFSSILGAMDVARPQPALCCMAIATLNAGSNRNMRPAKTRDEIRRCHQFPYQGRCRIRCIAMATRTYLV